LRAGAPPGLLAAMSLRERLASGIGWTATAHWVSTLTGLVTVVVLGRLLVPGDFAVVAAAGALAALVGIVQESGLGAAVVQHAGDDDRAATTALVLNVALATAGLALCVAVSPWLAAFFQIEQRAALAVAFTPLWLRAWTNVPKARLQKALAFRQFAMIELSAALVYPAVAVPLALGGTGAWALVLGQCAAGVASAAAAWLLARWRPRLRDLDWEVGRRLASFGRPILGANLLAMVNDQIDNWVTGRLLGPSALGLYAMAFRIANLPRTGFTFVVSQVLYPALARLHDDQDRFRAVFLRSLHWVAVLSVPASVGLALLAPDLIRVVLGTRWEDAATPTRILAGFGLLASLSATTGDVFKAAGRPQLILRIGLVHSAALWLGLAMLARRGLGGVALAVTLATAASSLAAFTGALAILRLRVTALVRALAAPVLATATMTGVLLGLRDLVLPAGGAGLAGAVLAGAGSYAVALALCAPGDLRELGSLLGVAWPARGRLRPALRSR
jgi:O-antigen/teichoic acid export membrane protein